MFYPEHIHASMYTVGIVLRGNVAIKKKEQILHYKPNMAYVIFPCEPHTIYSDNNYSMLSVCISKNFVCNYSLGKAKILFEDVLSDLHIQSNILCSFECFYSALEAIYLHKQYSAPDKKDEFIEAVKKYMQDFPENRLNLEQISRIMYISKYHLIRKFKEEIGLTPHKFQIQNQVRKAQRLLENGLPITEVALATGFYDQSHLIKHFRSIVGITPSKYKAASRQFNIL